jgi:DNA-binding transcriptional LysR family regulator
MIFDFRLRVFYTVACRMSFTKASEELFITQPAVTKHIHELEQQFSTKLFERRGNNIALTEAGKTLFRYTKELTLVYNQLEQEMSSLTGSTKGTLTIGASTTIAQYILPAALADFKLKFKEIVLKVITNNTEEVEQKLLSGEIDLGFIEGYTKNKQIKYIPFSKDEIVLVGKQHHPWANLKNLLPDDLQKAKLVMREHGSGTLEVILLALKKAGLKTAQLAIEIQLDSTEAIKSYLLNSDSLAFLSKHAIEGSVAKGPFKIIPVKGLQIERPLNAIHLQGAPSRMASIFLKFMTHHNLK